MHSRLQVRSAVFALLAVVASLALASEARAQRRPAMVDLRDQQTPIRNQGGRGTCIIHSVVAAMEAALKRGGYGDVDLSEDAFMYYVKLFWMDTDASKQPGQTENQIVGTDGGSAVENLHYLTGGLAVPEESAGFPDGYDYKITIPWDNAHWRSQFNIDSWNLSPTHLNAGILRAPRYFTVTSFKELPSGSDAAAIEAALASGHEVMWGFSCSGKRPGNATWTYDGPAKPSDGGHSMLFVGYDRRDAKHAHFIVKNSWGPTSTPGAKGFTYISYDYLKYGTEAAYITGVTKRSWPELRFIGRWAVHFDGWEGILDISHLPGVFQGVLDQKGIKARDRRIGMFYEKNDPNQAYRVNGSIKGNRIDFYVDGNNTNAPMSRVGGRHFTYYLNAGDSDLMAGAHRDPDGSVWGGYARRLQSDAAFPAEAQTITVADLPEMAKSQSSNPLPASPKVESYLGSWKLQARKAKSVVLTKRDDSVVPADKQAEWAGLTGEGVVALVNKANPAECELTFQSKDGKPSFHFAGRLLSWERGVVAGSLASEQGKSKVVYGATLVH